MAFSDTAEMIFSGGIDNIIKGWDLRKLDVAMRLTGHTDTVTGLSLSPDGNFLLSNAMDNTLRVWDVRPYAPTERCTKVIRFITDHRLGYVCYNARANKIILVA